MNQITALLEKLKQLPPQRQAQVEDFIDFLRDREEARSRAAAAVAALAFAKVWENEEDAVYDKL